MSKEYWKNSWVEGHPLIIAINAFHNPYTSMIPDSKIIEYLYKRKISIQTDKQGNQVSNYTSINNIKYNERDKPAGFFGFENAENISAVIFYNERPLWKFNRMGYLDSDKILMQRYGFKYDSNPSALKPIEYNYLVKNENHIEEWNEGFSVFHNPNAKIPLNKEIFCGFRQLWVEPNGSYGGFMPDFFPFTSQTIILMNK